MTPSVSGSVRYIVTAMLCVAAAVLFFACSTSSKKIQEVRTQEMSATLALSNEIPEDNEYYIQTSKRDTITFTDDATGEQTFLMTAELDEKSGEMMASETIDAAVVTARFRNVAERHGKIDLRFEIIVPEKMQDSEWQLRFYPDMFILGDSLRLESVYITGKNYRYAQLRGYERYNKFLSTIINDTTYFIDYRNLEIFIKRNIPKLYAFRSDTTEVSEEEFASVFGVTEREAIDHYTRTHAKRMNERRRARMDKMFAKYVKAPIVSEGLRLDTVLQNINGDYVYQYVQTINTRPKLRQVDIVLSGDIYKQDQHLYTMSRTDPLTFYISSLSSFVDGTERYLKQVVYRRVEANTKAKVDFAVGKADVNRSLGDNDYELGRIEGYLRGILDNTKFDLDSIVISASASPEGSVKSNDNLSLRRAKAMSDYCDAFIKGYADSLRRAYLIESRSTVSITMDDEGHEQMGYGDLKKVDLPPIRFISRSGGENWPNLLALVNTDETMTEEQKEDFRTKCNEIRDLDAREAAMRSKDYYKYMKDELYPDLRTVRFDFHLHRKGMVKDTVQTTVLDSVYMAGVQAVRDRDYEVALNLLKPYEDFNTAIAYVCLDYNASALAILENLEKTDQVNYMLAILYSRRGDEQAAVQHFLRSVKQNPSFQFRGMLDPEIYALIKKYQIKFDEEEDDMGDL